LLENLTKCTVSIAVLENHAALKDGENVLRGLRALCVSVSV